MIDTPNGRSAWRSSGASAAKIDCSSVLTAGDGSAVSSPSLTPSALRPQAIDGDQRKKQHVVIGHHGRRRIPQCAAWRWKADSRIAPGMPVDHVVSRPQELVRRHREHRIAARRHERAQGRKTGDIRLDMLDNVEGAEQVERSGEGQPVGQSPILDFATGHIPRPLTGEGVGLDAFDLAELAQQRQVGAGTTADFENARIPRQRQVMEKAVQDAAARLVPPVLFLNLSQLAIDIRIHAFRPRPCAKRRCISAAACFPDRCARHTRRAGPS